MGRSTRGLVALALVVSGITLVTYVYAEIYSPTVAQPNYWVANSGGLLPLLFVSLIGDILLAGGVFLGVERLLIRARRGITPRLVRVTAGAAVLAGLIWLAFDQFRFGSILRTRMAVLGLGIGTPLLAAVGIIGLYALYGDEQATYARRGAALIGVGLTFDGFETVLSGLLIHVPMRTGALGYPASVLDGVGVLIFASGSVLFGLLLWWRSDVPRWIGGLLVVGVSGYLLVLIGQHYVRPLWDLIATIGLGVAWLGIGYHLWRSPTATRTPE